VYLVNPQPFLLWRSTDSNEYKASNLQATFMQHEESQLSRPMARNAFFLGKVSRQIGIGMAATQQQVNPSEQVGTLEL
jgi:hypothetical protein